VTLRNSAPETSRRSVAERSRTENDRAVLSEESFRRMISIERKRTERSRKPFLWTPERLEKERKSAQRSRIGSSHVHPGDRCNRLV